MNYRRHSALPLLIVFALAIPAGILESTASPSDADTSVNICRQTMAQSRNAALRSLSRLETNYIRMSWNLRKSWENTYVVQWEALQKKKDGFSEQRSAEGDVQEVRYNMLSRSYIKLARSDQLHLEKQIKELESTASSLNQSCPSAWGFENCVHFLIDKLNSHTSQLRDLLEQIQETQRVLTKKIKQTLAETPTEHTPYGNRLAPEFAIWNVQYEPEMFQILRGIREVLEFEMQKSDCCAQCTAEEIRATGSHQKNPLETGPRRGYSFDPFKNYSQSAVGASLKSLETEVKEKTLED